MAVSLDATPCIVCDLRNYVADVAALVMPRRNPTDIVHVRVIAASHGVQPEGSRKGLISPGYGIRTHPTGVRRVERHAHVACQMR